MKLTVVTGSKFRHFVFFCVFFGMLNRSDSFKKKTFYSEHSPMKALFDKVSFFDILLRSAHILYSKKASNILTTFDKHGELNFHRNDS